MVGFPRRVEPVDQHGEGHQHHEQDACRGAAAAEHLVGDPAAQQGAWDPRPLIEEVGPGGVIHAGSPWPLSDRWRPVQHAVTDEVGKALAMAMYQSSLLCSTYFMKISLAENPCSWLSL